MFSLRRRLWSELKDTCGSRYFDVFALGAECYPKQLTINALRNFLKFGGEYFSFAGVAWAGTARLCLFNGWIGRPLAGAGFLPVPSIFRIPSATLKGYSSACLYIRRGPFDIFPPREEDLTRRNFWQFIKKMILFLPNSQGNQAKTECYLNSMTIR